MAHRPDELARRLGFTDAVVIGLGAMVGAGVFAVAAPAASAAGPWLLVGLLIASAVAYANATSSAQLAALYPEAGGTYVYAGRRLGDYWGFLAGWSFVVGKTASLSAMALTFGFYVHDRFARPLAIAAIAVLTAVNYRGVEKTARLTRLVVVAVLVMLAVVVAAAVSGGDADIGRLAGDSPNGVLGVIQSAAVIFFAFAGYARLATLGEEVRDPRVTIPKAIPVALGIVVVVYAAVLGSAVLVVGSERLAVAAAPLVTAVEAGRWAAVVPVVRVAAGVATVGVLLSLLAGVSRTALSMARRRDLPAFLDAVHPTFRTPYRAEVAAAVAVAGVVLIADLRQAIGFSSFGVLTYYALANASAWTLSTGERRWPRWLSGFGAAGCVALALSLPLVAVAGGAGVLAAGTIVWWLKMRRRAAGGQQ